MRDGENCPIEEEGPPGNAATGNPAIKQGQPCDQTDAKTR